MSTWLCTVIGWNQDMANPEEIKSAFAKSEKIGVIGSPSSSSDLTLDILGTAVEKQLVGNLSIFNFRQENNEQYALGQITEITMSNPMTQDSTVKSIIRHKSDGRVDPLTERQDTHVAKMMLSSVFSVNSTQVEQSMLGTVPATGTLIKLLDNDMLNSLLADYQRELFYLGKIYGADVLMPMWFKHFGSEEGGINEAYHMGIFGKTGSGKSFLAKMMITAYARHSSMSVFVFDPQGEFSQEFAENSTLGNILRHEFNKDVRIISVQDIVLNFNQALFKDILDSTRFFKELQIWSDDHKSRTVDEINRVLNPQRAGQGRLDPIIPPWEWHSEAAFNMVWDGFEQILKRVAGTPVARERMVSAWRNANRTSMQSIWTSVCNLFRYTWQDRQRIRMEEVFTGMRNQGAFLVLNLAAENIDDLFWDETTKLLVTEQIIHKIADQAESVFNQVNDGGQHQSMNTLVVLDEAHRMAPREKSDTGNESLDNTLNGMKDFLVDAVRTTRKFGLGWLFVSQTLSSLDKRIIDQLRIFMLGFGLAWGLERLALRDLIGGNDEALRLYQQFKDPQSTLGVNREYSFMTVGPISPLSFSGTPLFFKSLDYPDEFVEINKLINNEN